MLRVKNDVKGIKSAAENLREEVGRLAYRELKVTRGFPNGERVALDSYVLQAPRHDIYVGFGALRDNTFSQVFRLVDHNEDPYDAFYPNAEVNVSALGSRAVAGVLASSGEQVLLCHRGIFNAFRTRIKRETALAFFHEYLIPATDGDKELDVIPVVALGARTFVADLETFVLRVMDLKEQFKAGAVIEAPIDGGTAKVEDPWRWNDGDEFEGKKSARPRGDVSYEYLHGPLCNRLAGALEVWAKGSKYAARRTINIDSALVGTDSRARVIFEVKTSASLSEQLYKAVGQLFHYRKKRGNAETLLALVLPGEVRDTAGSAVPFFRDLGIHVVFEAMPGRFQLAEGAPLEGFLDSRLK